MGNAKPTARQVDAARRVCDWYLGRYYGTPDDLGFPATFMRPEVVGAFAVTPDEWARADAKSLFRLLVATTLFQRRQDQQVFRILQSMSAQQVREVSAPKKLLASALSCACPLMRTQRALIEECDLQKDAAGRGDCATNPGVNCQLKQHTVWLKRYGHFGKVPTSAALMLREAGARDLSALYRRVVKSTDSPRERSVVMERALSAIWRISEKIAAMYLSNLSNPDLSKNPPWPELDSTYFVVIDSNTDLFLRSLRYSGSFTYAARREYLWRLAESVDWRQLRPSLQSYNPRLLQQAAYLFMSRTNRRASSIDCWRDGAAACAACPSLLRSRCGVRSSSQATVAA